MAVLIPAEPKACSYSEKLVYQRCGRELDDQWVVLHSLGLVRHRTKIWGEADIVILSTKGIFALEVKGGSVECKDGIWQFGDPAKGGYTKKEDPWTQAKTSMFAVQDELEKADPAFSSLLFGFDVVMPNETFTTTGCEIEPAVLLDRRYFGSDLNRYLKRLQVHWTDEYRARHKRSPKLPSAEDIRKARRILRPNVESAFSLGSYLNGVDAQLVELTNSQIRAARRLDANPRTIVRGKAGTGKTIIAIERARKLAKSGKRVLFLCFNRLLAEHIRASLASERASYRIEVRHIHSLFRETINSAGLGSELDEASADPQRLYGEVFPALFTEAVLSVEPEPWDALIVDEAQDLLTPANLDAMDLILKEGLDRGCWHLFLDPNQNIFSVETQEAAEARLQRTYPTFDELAENCRNTRQVAIQASIISGIDLETFGAPDGPACETVYYTSPRDFLEQLEQIVGRLIRAEVRPADIAILSTRKRENSLVAGLGSIAGQTIVDAENLSAGSSGDIVFATMHAFKGLERQVVLAIDMEGIGAPDLKMLHYAGLSRACGLLRTFLPAKKRTAYNAQAKAFADRMTESQ